MSTGVFTITYRAILQADFGAAFNAQADGINGSSSAIITNLPNARYNNNPLYIGIELIGGSGSARSQLCFDERQVGNKVLIYLNYGNNWWEVQVQIWGAGCWVIENPGTGGGNRPANIILGTPVPLQSDFPPEEKPLSCVANPSLPGCTIPPPQYNPFIPNLLINLDHEQDMCMLVEKIRVTINPIPNVTIRSATVYKDGQPTGITLAQLRPPGYVFESPGNYEVRVVYRYDGDGINNPPDPPGVYTTLIRDFTISKAPFPHIQMKEIVYGYVLPGQALKFNTVVEDDGTITYDPITGEFTLDFCGYYKIKWFVATQSSLTTDGINFAITINDQPDMIGSSHASVGETVGFSIVKVDGAPPIITLVNASDGIIELSQVAEVKAGIIINKIGDVS